MQAFDLKRARQASLFARVAYAARRKGAISLEHRNIISNDTKLIAQAQVAGAQFIAGRDQNLNSVLSFLRSEKLTSVQYLDITVSPAKFFGELF